MTSREKWSSWYEFIFSCIGSTVGLGNIWRFPYLCYNNGGGAFLIPFVLFLFLVGIPMTYLEMAYCQFSNMSPAKAWIAVPLLRGVGFGMASLVAIFIIYLNVIIAWTIYYFVSTFRKTLPWTTCDNEWNTAACYLRIETNRTFANVSVLEVNTSVQIDVLRKTATEEFWDNKVLERSVGIEQLGSVRWELFGCLALAWLFVLLSLVRGIKTSGKVMYVAATLPYILLLVLLCRSATLDGALYGLKYFIIPKWDKLTSLTVWTDAATQALFSLGIGSGAMGTLASFNNFNNNIRRDATILPFIDLFTSLFSGCVIFISLGSMAKAANLSIDDVVSQGPGIAFMVYPEALSQLPLPQLWSAIFFLMLIIVGLDSQIVNLQIITTALADTFPKLFRPRPLLTTTTLCLLCLLLGIPCVTQGGVYVLQTMDWYLASICLILIPFVEVVGQSWCYGVDRLCGDMALMSGHKVSRVWKWAWKYVTPVTTLLIWIFSMVKLKPLSYGDIQFPQWAIGVGWALAAVPISVMVIPSIVEVSRAKGSSIYEKLKASLNPKEEWGPCDEKARALYESRDVSATAIIPMVIEKYET